jgi:hypothetical protein
MLVYSSQVAYWKVTSGLALQGREMWVDMLMSAVIRKAVVELRFVCVIIGSLTSYVDLFWVGNTR